VLSRNARLRVQEEQRTLTYASAQALKVGQMTKEERRAEKIRMLVQSGSLFAEAARTLAAAQGVSFESALTCVAVAELTCGVSGIQYELDAIRKAVEAK
jgi:hypothetical protein